MRKTLLLDGNIYNRLQADTETRCRLNTLIADGMIRVIATPVLVGELEASPFCGLPDWFPIETEAKSVFVLGHARLDMARLGKGEIYSKHRGQSNKVPDAIIADSADGLADVLVSDDRRCRKRLADISSDCAALDYDEFVFWLRELEAGLPK